jgi:ferric-dicitrate binding protein FerR (iron transport regulator)
LFNIDEAGICQLDLEARHANTLQRILEARHANRDAASTRGRSGGVGMAELGGAASLPGRRRRSCRSIAGGVLGGGAAASLFWCSVLSWVGSPEAEVGVGERVCCGREKKVKGIG